MQSLGYLMQFELHLNLSQSIQPTVRLRENLYKYNKNWETLLPYLLRTKVSWKAVEIAATRSLNAQLFFVMQHTKRSIKKIPHIEITTSWPFHWHASLRKHPFLLALRRLRRWGRFARNVPSDEERGETDVFVGYWHASSLTLLINILPEGQSSWPELFILFHLCCCIESPV